MAARWRMAGAAALAAVCAGLALAQPAVVNAPPNAPGTLTPPSLPFQGYLGPAGTPDAYAILPPPPQPGTDRYERDRRIFHETRALEGTPRWSLAQTDNGSGIDAMMQHFSCALDAQLTPVNAPHLAAMMRRLAPDHSRIVNRAKDRLQRLRPYFIDEGTICIARNSSTDGSYDYPSGHASWGWEWGMILAEIAPDRATPIFVRARAFGESRVVCGVHNASTLEASRTTASALIAAEHGSATFRADLEAARAEMAQLRAMTPHPDAAACAAEAELTAHPPWTN